MGTYILRRLLLMPITLFCILLINFVIINLAPGEPTSMSQISPDGGRKEKDNASLAGDERYLQFREHYGLTLPILFNNWPWISLAEVQETLEKLAFQRDRIPVKEYDALRVGFGDRSRFVMDRLLTILEDPKSPAATKEQASRFFIRGGTRQAVLGPNLSPQEREWNNLTASNNLYLRGLLISSTDAPESMAEKISKMRGWYEKNKELYGLEPSQNKKLSVFFFETRFCRYFSKVLTLDFGTLRNDSNRTVLSEVSKRFKYSFTLALIPMLITFFLSLFFGFLMALKRGRWPDFSLNLLFLFLYSLPIFVMAPFLIETIALGHNWPGTNTPIPYSGFTSPDEVYNTLTSEGRLFNTLEHIALPLVAILYGSLAAESRLARTAVLEVLRQDYVRTARAKGLSTWSVLTRHVGRNAAITIVTSLAGSFGILLGGSLIVETLFEINGFGRFFYEGVVNRDYNVILFSALAGSFLTLVGYLAADIAYTLLDPRVTLD
jgi:peptide/nickel transport system permease protein